MPSRAHACSRTRPSTHGGAPWPATIRTAGQGSAPRGRHSRLCRSAVKLQLRGWVCRMSAFPQVSQQLNGWVWRVACPPHVPIIVGAGGFYLSRVSNAPIAERPRLGHKTCNWLQLVGETDARPCIYTFPADGGVRGAGRDGSAFRSEERR